MAPAPATKPTMPPKMNATAIHSQNRARAFVRLVFMF